MMNKAAAHSKHEYQKWYMMNAELPGRLELLLTEPITDQLTSLKDLTTDMIPRPDNMRAVAVRQQCLSSPLFDTVSCS